MSFAFTLAVFIGAFIWLATEKTPKHIVVLCGSLALLLGRIITLRQAVEYVNWSTLLLLLVLLISVEALSYMGFFGWLASVLVRGFKKNPTPLFFILPLLAGALSMAVSNITAMVFMTTLTWEICRHLPLNPISLIVGEVCCANMMGAATLIGAPPNLLMATTLGYGFSRVAAHMIPGVSVCTLIFMIFHYTQHRQELKDLSGATGSPSDSPQRKAFHIDIQILLFFMGLFILVGGLDHVGLFQVLAKPLSHVQQPLLLSFAVLWLTAVSSAFVDNIPMALAMAFLIKNLAALSPSFPSSLLVWSALLGLTLGGNMTPIGASPNVVAYSFLEKQSIRMGWKKWAILTVPGTLSALVAASGMLFLQYKTGWY